MTEKAENNDGPCSPAEQAIDWLVRSRSGSAEAFDPNAFEEWCRQDPENRREFEKAETIWHALKPLQPIFGPKRRRGWVRTSWIGLAAALAAVFVVGLFVSNDPWLTPTTYTTAKADRRDVTLSDGSIIHLNADSVVVAEASLWKRRYRLDQGEAVFEVAHNPWRPFEVAVGNAVICDLGTRFDVRRETDDTRLSVFEGSVDLGVSDGQQHRTIHAGQAVHFDFSGISQSIPIGEHMLTAWRNGRFTFAESPLADAVVQLNRYRQNPVVIRDAAIAKLRISGNFDTGNTDGILRALELALPIIVQNDPANGQVLLMAKPTPAQPKYQP
jgi:transmembrane sensor